MPESQPNDDAALPADPFDAELVAYLDGELEAGAARRVEARLASDPQARIKASALKKTYELLDYLPRPEPSATFTSRTLERLPAIPAAPRPASLPQAPIATPTGVEAVSATGVLMKTSGSTLARPSSNGTEPHPAREEPHWHRFLWIAGFLLAVVSFATAGYFTASAFRSHPNAVRTLPEKEITDELTLGDRRLIENLPIYAAVDDFAFASELAKPTYFGLDPNVAYHSLPHVPPVAQEPLNGEALAKLEKAYKQLTPNRQQAIRELDRQLFAEAPVARDRLLRVLECYRVWLNALPESDYRAVLAAAAPELRLKQISQIRERQWIESLPPSRRKDWKTANEDLKRKYLAEWKEEEENRQKEWAKAQKHPDMLDPNKVPWPFENEQSRKEVIAFAASAFNLNDPKTIRLSKNDEERYRNALKKTQQAGASGGDWFYYGKLLHELVKTHEKYLLPAPAETSKRITDLAELPRPYKRYEEQLKKKKVDAYAGVWPEFALEVNRVVQQIHKAQAKVDVMALPPLGPAKMSEFVPPVRQFLETELWSKLDKAEREKLARDENKWPEYPLEIIRLAKEKNVSIPGIMLPGAPRQWDEIYGNSGSKP